MEKMEKGATTSDAQVGDGREINKKLIEEIRKDVLKAKTGKEKRYFSRFIEMIKSDEVPKIRGSIVGRTGKYYRSWKRGVVISIRNKKIAGIVIMLKHNADVHYRHVFPGYRWYEKAEAGIKSQLKELIGNGRLKEDDILVVDFEDYEANTYDNSYTIEVKISELLPFLV